eukprot:2524545-Pyramimonas_sp.AAC.1
MRLGVLEAGNRTKRWLANTSGFSIAVYSNCLPFAVRSLKSRIFGVVSVVFSSGIPLQVHISRHSNTRCQSTDSYMSSPCVLNSHRRSISATVLPHHRARQGGVDTPESDHAALIEHEGVLYCIV